MFSMVIIRTNELCLKGGNRGYFEVRLMDDIARRLKSVGKFRLTREQGTIILRQDAPFTPAETAAIKHELGRTFGVGNFSFAAGCARDLDAAAAVAVQALAGRPGTFKIESRREDKSYPLTSIQISQDIAGRVLDKVPGLKVDVHNPDTTITVSVHKDSMRVQSGREIGLGGLPAGSSGRVVCLLSGGIDSPVAAFKMMRRGCRPFFVHCHSYPYTNDGSIQKVKRLAKILAGHVGSVELNLVPIADAQREMVAKAAEPFRVVLYRRFMLRAAEAFARRRKAHAVVTGDSVGQVASQTLENIRAVSAAATYPIFRPLIADDKEEISQVAKRIGTFETSIERQDDCCSLFMPRSPIIHASIREADAEEAKYDVAALLASALERSETIEITSDK